MKIRGKAPRNPLIVLVKQRKAGSHAPTLKVQRQKANLDLRRQLRKKEPQ